MVKPLKRYSIRHKSRTLVKGKSPLWFGSIISGISDRNLILFILALPISVLLFSEVGANLVRASATPGSTVTQMAQQPDASSTEANHAAAEQALAEGMQLFEEGTAESLRQAIPQFEKAVILYRQAGDQRSEALSLGYIGYIYSSLGEKQKALEFFNQALPLLGVVGDRREEAATLHHLGLVYDDLGEKQKALEFYNQALRRLRAVGDRGEEAATLNNIGVVYNSWGEKQKALEFYNQALPLLRAVGDRGGEAATLNNIGLVYDSWGEKQKALEFYNQALPLLGVVGDRRGEAATLNNMGTVYHSWGEKQKALEFYNQALPLSQAVGDRELEANTLNNMGTVYHSWGEKQKALEFYNQALPLFRAVGYREKEAATLNNIGGVYDSWGEKQKALEFYNQSLSLSQAVGNRKQEARTLNNMGLVYDSLGEKQKALEFYNQALPLSQAVGDRELEALTLNNIGGVYNSLGEKQKALEFYNQALPLSQAVGNRELEALTLNNIGFVYNSWGEKQKALEFYNQALPLFRAVGDREGEATTLNNIGGVYSSLGEKQNALEFYNQALPLIRALGNREGEATTLSNIAFVQRSQGKLKEALTLMDSAITIIEDLRTKIGSQELRTTYFATQQDDYEFYIDLLMQLHKQNSAQGYDAEALHISERSRARSLLELLTEANADIRQGVDPQLVAQERSLQQRLDAHEKRRLELFSGNYTQKQVDTLEQEQKQLLSEYQEIQTKIRTTSPRYAALTQPQPLKLAEIQQQVLDEDTLLLQYSLGEERSYLWAVTKTNLNSYELPPRAEIEAAAQQFLELLKTDTYHLGDSSNSISGENPQATAAVNQLSQMLLGQVAEHLVNKRLLIVSDGALQYIPFAALPIPSTLAENKDCVNQTSLISNRLVGAGSPIISPIHQNLDKPAPAASVTGKNWWGWASLPFISPSQQDIEKPAPTASSCQGEVQITPLLANHEIINLPSATTLGIIREEQTTRQTAPKALAILADPVFTDDDERFNSSQTSRKGDGTPNVNELLLNRSAREVGMEYWDRLPNSRTEAEAIMALVPESERIHGFDFAANREMITNPQLSNYRIIHLATHGLFNETSPELSGIVLSLLDKQGNTQNGFLRLHDIFNLDLPAELVVLSACETGLGEEVQGEGIVGLTRGFMYAGSPRVLVSLWSVNDLATAELMKRFYRLLLEEDLSATACRRIPQNQECDRPEPGVGGDKRKFWRDVMGFKSPEAIREAILAKVSLKLLEQQKQL